MSWVDLAVSVCLSVCRYIRTTPSIFEISIWKSLSLSWNLDDLVDFSGLLYSSFAIDITITSLKIICQFIKFFDRNKSFDFSSFLTDLSGHKLIFHILNLSFRFKLIFWMINSQIGLFKRLLSDHCENIQPRIRHYSNKAVSNTFCHKLSLLKCPVRIWINKKNWS